MTQNEPRKGSSLVLLLARVELAFFTVAGVGMCFGFLLNNRFSKNDNYICNYRNLFVMAEQELHRAKVFSAFYTARQRNWGCLEGWKTHSWDR